ncbi:MAG: hypothetical protein G3M78_09445 [Candidatus Nitrohelix vancouverensis]|uniref:Uncharacterized protein n=1 Tax=Candidatus Nitrohelix vancouverensis TaxID=2705534 RepID=A0A7T0C2Z3_9BACT|nr:MAG: hypothetical protein G3M78_09445 [Candidatus Nitrohelix vancouverensis]
MENERLIDFWRHFFSDLFLGTFKRLFMFGSSGLGLGILGIWSFQAYTGDSIESGWQEWSLLIFGGGWYLFWGLLHALIACAIYIVARKILEMADGLHGLLDLLTRQVMEKFKRTSKLIPRKQLEDSFNNFGYEFLERLRLKGGVTPSLARLFFALILKALRFFVLDDVLEELSRKPGDQLSSADIEHAVRRVGSNFALSTISDQFDLLQILNAVLFILFFSLPFGVFWLF